MWLSVAEEDDTQLFAVTENGKVILNLNSVLISQTMLHLAMMHGYVGIVSLPQCLTL